MASVDMCEHDWPGSGCKECRAEQEIRKNAPPAVQLLAKVMESRDTEDLLLLGKIQPIDVKVSGDKVVKMLESVGSTEGWHPIATAPTDDRNFLVGMWMGERYWNEDYTDFVWAERPVWVQVISHHENLHGPHVTRGWNHRNGPLSGKAEYWKELDKGPPFVGKIAQQETAIPVEDAA